MNAVLAEIFTMHMFIFKEGTVGCVHTKTSSNVCSDVLSNYLMMWINQKRIECALAVLHVKVA